MLRLQFYVLRRLAVTLLLVVAVVSTVLFVGQTVRFLDRMPDVGPAFLLSVLPLFLPVTLALTLPMAFLVALVLTYGRMADDNEVIAMRMAGIHPWSIAAPGVFAGVAVAFACLHLQGNLAPRAIAAQDGIRTDAFRQFLEVVERAERNSFTTRDFKISWEGIEGGELRELHISRGSGPGAQEIHAARGTLRRGEEGGVLVFTLRDFVMIGSGEGAAPPTRGTGITFVIEAADLLGLQGGIAKPRALPRSELLFRMFRLPPGSPARMEVEKELWSRASVGLSPLAFALCGIPLALLVGKGSRAAAAVLAFGVALAYFVLWQVGNGLATAGTLPPAPAMLAGPAILGAAGIVLFRRAVLR